MDAEILHRAQFGINLTFHYIYPPLSIGLSVALIIFEWLRRDSEPDAKAKGKRQKAKLLTVFIGTALVVALPMFIHYVRFPEQAGVVGKFFDDPLYSGVDF